MFKTFNSFKLVFDPEGELITSRSNQKIKFLRSLNRSKKRIFEGVFMVEGIRLVEEACRTPELIKEVYYCKRISEQERGSHLLKGLEKSGIPVFLISDSVGNAISDTKHPQGIFALIKRLESTDDVILSESSFLGVLLYSVQDPGNLGSILRISEAFGVTGLFYAQEGVDPFHPKVVRSSMGSIFRVPIASGSPNRIINKCRKNKIQVFTAELRAKKNFCEVDFKRPTLMIFGQEGSGLPAEITAIADGSVSIPINPSVESLNVAVAASIILHEAARQRGGL